LPKVYQRIQYTPQELRLKFTQYVERSDREGEEIAISWFAVYSQTAENYLTDKKDCQDFSEVIGQIMLVFEYRYEQKSANWVPMQYLMNNRFRGKRESLTKNEQNVKVNQDINTALDDIVLNGWKPKSE
jgi:hypothetical protein